MLTTDEIRRRFLDFFKTKGSKIIASSSLVPKDPSLLFTNAGMVQFKNYFNNSEEPEFSRVATVQKCVRAGGKHNDLDNVGYTARHHTFFEMLGNFSFGDYFKREAITWAWEFLTDVLEIPAEKLLVTVYHDDLETHDIWKNTIGLATDKIIKISTKDNFWEMGDSGPCGPCTEIFYDHGENIAGGIPGSAEEDGDRYVEIWNIVFTQFNRNKNGELEELPKKNIDTGIGLERMAAVLQGVHNNYEIDLFKNLIENSRNLIKDGDITAHRIIADHLRSSCFLICDGVLPSNEGRGYVLRRIMRRSMLQLYKLGCREASMYRLVPCLVQTMGEAYPELGEHKDFAMETLLTEENKFRATLEKGMKVLENMTRDASGNILDGKSAFELYDTYGFPLDLTEIILKDRGNIVLDVDGFNREMSKQKTRARENWVGSGDTANSEAYLNSAQKTNFLGYDALENYGTILQLLVDNRSVNSVQEGEQIELVSDSTCFFGEMGGQVGDRGEILLKDSADPGEILAAIDVYDTQRTAKETIVHRGNVKFGKFSIGDRVYFIVDGIRRDRIRANHSATHLLQFALRTVLGTNVISQRGSRVSEEHLRFDFSCDRPIDDEILGKVEEIVNSIIMENNEVKTEITTFKKAKELGAVALFSEKYGENVRVISMGTVNTLEKFSLAGANAGGYNSVELCGGTHVRRTGDIGLFKIIRVEPVASGVRRIEACSGKDALNYINEKIAIVQKISAILKTNHSSIFERVKSLLDENKELKKHLANAEKSKILNIAFEEKMVKGIRILFGDFRMTNGDPNNIKQLILSQKKTKYSSGAMIFAVSSGESNKNIAMIALADDLVGSYDASSILKNLGVIGGGARNFAMGSTSKNIDINYIETIILQMEAGI
ncbi:MAG: alanine--tRNA ligase [Rickettsiales bacterium]|jgi:alanyl-tRNA synthetase|nr:alanine--tRNA ligase [Rickettsiales bacterium]